MSLNKLLSDNIEKYPRQIIWTTIFATAILGLILGALKLHEGPTAGFLSNGIYNILVWAGIGLSAAVFSSLVAILSISKTTDLLGGIDGDKRRTYTSVLKDLESAMSETKSNDSVLNVYVTNLGVRKKTQESSTNFSEYEITLNSGIKKGKIHCRLLFLVYDKASAEWIQEEAKEFREKVFYEIKVIIQKYRPVLPVYNIYSFGNHVSKLSIENSSKNIISIHQYSSEDQDSTIRIRNAFEDSWAVDEAKFLLKDGEINELTLAEIQRTNYSE